MNSARVALVAVLLFSISQPALAQDLSRYRAYVLDSSVTSVIAASGARAADVKTLHERPARIQELEWNAPYQGQGSGLVDPVRGAVFAFYDDALYQVVVTYNRDRTDGLTDRDIVESLTAVYGAPVPRSAKNRQPAALPDSIVVALWEGQGSSLTLLRETYAPEFKLVLTSKALSARARSAIREATRLEALDAPRRELQQRKKDAADAEAVRARTRTANKEGFRP
jgi:hypothetical protein